MDLTFRKCASGVFNNLHNAEYSYAISLADFAVPRMFSVSHGLMPRKRLTIKTELSSMIDCKSSRLRCLDVCDISNMIDCKCSAQILKYLMLCVPQKTQRRV